MYIIPKINLKIFAFNDRLFYIIANIYYKQFVIMESINENAIIKNALNESINEFLLEEGAWDKLKGFAGKAYNWVRNGIANYMNKQTNGEWNKNYGINTRNGGWHTAYIYLNNWMKYHYSKVYDILHPRLGQKTWIKDEDGIAREVTSDIKSNWGKIVKDAREYIYKNCTAENFMQYIGYKNNEDSGFLRNDIVLKISDYITTYLQGQYNYPENVLKYLNYNSFIKNYDSLNGQYNPQEKQNNQQTQANNGTETQAQNVYPGYYTSTTA